MRTTYTSTIHQIYATHTPTTKDMPTAQHRYTNDTQQIHQRCTTYMSRMHHMYTNIQIYIYTKYTQRIQQVYAK